MRRQLAVPRAWRRVVAVTCGLAAAAAAFAQPPPINLEVDATDAPRKILHARLQIPAHPGPLTLLYPKWIPGEHGPTGPVTDLAGLKMTALGQPVPWQRDDENMFAVHLQVPAGADMLEVKLDFLLPPGTAGFSSGASATAQLLDLSWNQVLLYPEGVKASDVKYIGVAADAGGVEVRHRPSRRKPIVRRRLFCAGVAGNAGGFAGDPGGFFPPH